KTLNDAGWVRGQDGKRAKGGQPLRIAIASVKTGDYPKVVEKLTENWNKIGITVQTVLVNPEEVQQDIIAPRSYDVLLYELAIGGDPDVFAYWHSSQANSRGLNLANYNSGKADDALDSARSRFEMDLRAAKYKTFVDQWLEDVPGVVLYQPNLHYVTKTTVSALEGGSLVDAVDRYRNVQYWSVSQDVENQTP
ncbi:hypothetical protein CYG49_03395, partial [Candidatus Saccharibacteria bacterium]